MFASEYPSPVRVGPSVVPAEGSASQTKRHRLCRAVEGDRPGVADADDGGAGQMGKSGNPVKMPFGGSGLVEGGKGKVVGSGGGKMGKTNMASGEAVEGICAIPGGTVLVGPSGFQATSSAVGSATCAG